MVAKRYLIVNADDFGQSHDINRGVILSYEQGIVTSASLMVRQPAAFEAAAYSRHKPDLSVGIHFDFGEWAYRHDTWVPLYEVVSMDDKTAVKNEICGQLTAFRDLVGRDPTHIDSHQHAHRKKPVSSILLRLAQQLGVPLRHHSPLVTYCGSFYGQSGNGQPFPEPITVEGLIGILKTLGGGITELSCHPGRGNDFESMYLNERAREVRVLCDPRIRAAIVSENIELRSFQSLRPMLVKYR